jgi:hypothetical protein
MACTAMVRQNEKTKAQKWTSDWSFAINRILSKIGLQMKKEQSDPLKMNKNPIF